MTSRRRRGVLVVGEAGIGKSRFAQELVGDLRGRGYATEWVRASSGAASIPLAALADLLPQETPEALWVLFRSALHSLAQRGNRMGPLILAVDDVQHLDDVSAALIHQATHRGLVVPVLTARVPGSLPEPIERLWTEDGIERVGLLPLTRQATDELLLTVLGARATAPVRSRAWELSQGNPLLLRELVLAGVETVEDPVALASSDRIVELVAERLGNLDEDERALLEVLAVAETLELCLLEGYDDTGVLARLEEQRLAGVVAEGRRWSVRFYHPLHREVLAAGLPGSRRRTIAARLAQDLAATGLRRRGDLLRAATLHLDAGLPADPELLGRAAEAALAGFAYDLAIRFARAASMTDRAPGHLVVLGEALSRLGRGHEAEEELARATALAADGADLARVLIARAHNLAFVLGEASTARELLGDVLSRDDLDPWAATMLYLSEAWIAAIQGDYRGAIRLARRVIDDDTVVGEPRLEALVIATLGLVMVGDVDAAEPLIDRGLALAVEHRERKPVSGDLLETNRVMGWVFAGRVADAEDLARRRYEAAVAEGAPEVVALWAADLGFVAERRGDLEAALRHLAEAAEISRRNDPFGFRGMIAGLAAVAAAQMGDRDEFDRYAGMHHERLASEDFRVQTLRHRVTVWRQVLAGDLEEAAATAAELGKLGIERGSVNWAVITAYDAVRLGRPELVVDLLADTAASADGEMVATMSRHARALVAGDARGVAEAAAEFEAMGCDLYASEAYAEAARLYDRAGDRKASGRVRGRFAALRSAYPQVATPPLFDPPAVLTPRETQIARLAVGHTSREIAERLGISVRTVDNHLASVYVKLGVKGRRELGEVLFGAEPGRSLSAAGGSMPQG